MRKTVDFNVDGRSISDLKKFLSGHGLVERVDYDLLFPRKIFRAVILSGNRDRWVAPKLAW